MRKIIIFATILLTFALLPTPAIQAQTVDTAHVWVTYINARFAYSVCYPSDVLSPQGEPENMDGQKFTSKDGKAEVLVYGSYATDQTLKKAYLDEIHSDQDEGFTITYKLLKSDRFVLSGSRQGKILYEKTVQVGDVFKTLRLEYTDDVKQDFDAITSKMSLCFRTKLVSKTSPKAKNRFPESSLSLKAAED